MQPKVRPSEESPQNKINSHEQGEKVTLNLFILETSLRILHPPCVKAHVTRALTAAKSLKTVRMSY